MERGGGGGWEEWGVCLPPVGPRCVVHVGVTSPLPLAKNFPYTRYRTPTNPSHSPPLPTKTFRSFWHTPISPNL